MNPLILIRAVVALQIERLILGESEAHAEEVVLPSCFLCCFGAEI